MAKITFPSLAGGEISSSFYGRSDQDAYFVSAKALENYIAKQTGSAISRGGTMMVAGTKDDGRTLLLDFEFNDEQAYTLELGDRYGRVYRNRARQFEEGAAISAITAAAPGVFTVAHRLKRGRLVRVEGVVGMVEVNDAFYTTEQVLGSAKDVVDVQRTNPVRMELDTGHGFSGGEIVFVESVGGMGQINGRTFELEPITEGEWTIVAATNANPVKITTSQPHGLATGAEVLITEVAGMTQINNRRFTITEVMGQPTQFTLDSENGTTHGVYIASGVYKTVFLKTTGSLQNWTVPSDWTTQGSIVEVIAAGGGGFSPGLSVGGKGGGGGGYSRSENVSLVPGTLVPYRVGSGGPAGTIGGDTWFNGPTLPTSSVGAKGGAGAVSPQSGGDGGQAGGGIGSVKRGGGTGGNGAVGGDAQAGGGGGGGAGGPNGNGANGGSGDDDGGGGGGGGADGGFSGASAGSTPGASGGSSRLGSSSAGAGGKGGGASSAGNNGTNETLWAQTSNGETAGSGGGGGGGGRTENGGTGPSTSYGTGGGGGGEAGTGGAGRQGIIVIRYLPAPQGSGGKVQEVLADEFYLKDENGYQHDDYTSGGTVKPVSLTSLTLRSLDGVPLDTSDFVAYASGGTITPVHEFETPYGGDDLFDANGLPLIHTDQANDYLLLAHPDLPPMSIQRRAHDDFSAVEFEAKEGPLLDANTDLASTVYADGSDLAAGDTITLIASTEIWTEEHLGALWELRQKDISASPVWAAATAFSLAGEVRNGEMFYRCSDAGTSGSEAPTHDDGDAFDGPSTSTNCKWTFIHNGRGIVRITSIVSPQEVEAEIITEMPAGCVGAGNATHKWREGAWSHAQGFPKTVAIAFGRTCWGGTRLEPLAVDFSDARSPFLFNPVERNGLTTRETAFRRVIDGKNPIRWLKATDKGLAVGTLAGEFLIGITGASTGFGGDTANAVPVGPNGAASIQPIMNGDAILYVQAARKSVRDMVFTETQLKPTTSDRNLRADHVAEDSPFIACAYAETPFRVTWYLRADGKLRGLTYNREEGAKVSAWHRSTIGGSFEGSNAVVESLCATRSPDGLSVDLWLQVKRTIGGITKRSIEWMTQPIGKTDALQTGVYMDAAVSFSGDASATMGGLDHLIGETVTYLAYNVTDGIFCGTAVVDADGEIALPIDATICHAGLFAYPAIETVNLEASAASGRNTKDDGKRIYKAIVEAIHSGPGLYVGTNTSDELDRMVFDDFTQDDPPAALTGLVEETVCDQFDKLKSLRLEQRLPLRSEIASITCRFELGVAGE